jgi:putative FmdB family regulatory protein
MPTYILKCPKCKKEFEFLKLRANSKAICPKCGYAEDFEKLPTAPALSFKGEGWTTTNYSASVDPTTVPGVKKIENPTREQRTLYKTRKQATGRRKKVKVAGLPEVKRQLPLGKA